MECPRCKGKNSDLSHFCSHCGIPLRPSDKTMTQFYWQSDLPEGTRIAQKYKIIEKLGAGGMGDVYKAEDTRLMRTVALKFLPLELTCEPEYKERFIQEAQACSSLDYPNICTIFEIGETEEGRMFIAMAFCEGETLKSKIKNGPLPIKEAVDVSCQIAQGLAKTHSRGIIHRDIKPGNIILTKDGIVKILDFGLAKLTGGDRLTRTDAVLGTVSYMSPEQAAGEAITHQTDIWSLGVVLYEMVTSRLPFDGGQAQSVIYAIRNHSPDPPSELSKEVPEKLERIIYKCLEKKQKKRYLSAQRLLTDLNMLRDALESGGERGIPEKAGKSVGKKEAERRQATVMFIDISGVSGLFEKMDVEDVASIMSDFYRVVAAIEEKYEGKITKITDNSFSAVFGVPRAIEDAPKRAVNAAIEVRNQLRALNRRKNLRNPLHVHIGINTGIVITEALGASGKKDFPVLGDTVNFASQLKDAADKGKIYVGLQTYKYSHDTFVFKPLKPVLPEGKKKAVPIYELLSEEEKIYRSGVGSERMIHSPMVGREKELDKLELALLKVINGEGSILNIIGEAGIGKSRLLAELSRKEGVAKVSLLKGRALSLGKNLSFHPLIDLIKNWCGIKEKDSPLEAVYKLENTIKRIHPEGRLETFPFLATMMGMKLSGQPAERIKGIEGEALTKLILKNLRELIGKAADKKPLVFVIEDLHWADLTSIEFLESLYRLAETHRIFFINVFRPGGEDTSERIRRTVARRHSEYCSEIYLESLDVDSSEILINNLLKIKGLPPKIRERIIKRTGGNPFFIEEVVRSFIDEGAVEVRDGHFCVTERIESVVIPETINEVLMGRIDRLDEASRSLLRVASVIGRNFFHKILVEVVDNREDIDERLEFLQEIQLILERRRMDELEYLFKHALAQEAVYESILMKTRKRLHLKTATAIEAVFSDRLHEFYGMLALHYSKGEDLDKAEEFLIKAGEEALKSAASSEALNYYQEALHIYLRQYGEAAEAEKIAMLEKNIAIALYNKGQYVEADEYFTKTLSFYGERFPKNKFSAAVKFTVGFAKFLLKLYFPPLRRKRHPSPRDSEIINLLYKKNTALIILNTKRMFIESFYWLSRLFDFDLSEIENGVGILSMSGGAFSYGGVSFHLSRKVYDYVKDKVDTGDEKSLLYFKVPEVLLTTFSGDWANIGEYDNQLVEDNIKIGELFYTTSYIMIHGYSRIARGNYPLSYELAAKLQEVAKVYENDNARAAFYWYKTQVLVKFRKLEEALETAEAGIDFTQKKGFRPYLFSLLSFKARIYILQGHMGEAETALHSAESLEREVKIASYIYSTYLLSKLIYEIYRIEESINRNAGKKGKRIKRDAKKTARKAVKVSRKSAADIVEAAKLMGVFQWITGHRRRALRWWKRSVAEGQRLGARLELGRAYFEIGSRISGYDSGYKDLTGLSGTQLLNKARSVFLELELEYDLNRLEKEIPSD